MSFDQGFHDECGVFGIFNHSEAANLTYLGLCALQHRGQESAGIVSSDGKSMSRHRGMGYVADVFDHSKIEELFGDRAIGHVRYSTHGESFLRNAQPVAVSCWRGSLALSHNGDLINADHLRKKLEREGSIFQTTSDSEVILHLIAKAEEQDFGDAVTSTIRQILGAYSLIFLAVDRMIGVRDPHGFRPLVLGKVKDAFVLASETCALDLINADFIREIEPGEMVVIDENGLHSTFPFGVSKQQSSCIFELVYFARPDSVVFGESVYKVRKRMGRELARLQPVDADLVIPVPDSGIGAAIGVAEELNLPFEMGLIRNHYIGRTFIEPKQSIRDFGVKIKLNPVRSLLKDKRVVVVDDSIVRGTTSRKLVRMIRMAGAKEVHVRIASPPTIGSCRYGIDTPTKEELIAREKSVQEICRFIEADTLGYLTIEGLLKSVGDKRDKFCLACFNQKYPVEFTSD